MKYCKQNIWRLEKESMLGKMENKYEGSYDEDCRENDKENGALLPNMWVRILV